MNRYAFLLGSHPALSAVEIRAFFTRTGMRVSFQTSLFPRALLVESAVSLDVPRILSQLGGSPMAVQLLGELPELSAEAILSVVIPGKRVASERDPESTLSDAWVPAFAGTTKEEVQWLTVGLSVIGAGPDISLKDVRTIGMGIKRALKRTGFRLVVPQRGTELTSAQLVHEHIPDQGTGIAVIIAPDNTMHVGLIAAVQDIGSYARRDRERPKANPGRGMLPPKVAQMLLNLSGVPNDSTVYDPFCGTGTIPMEALLMGFTVLASDVAPSQVQDTKDNIAWLQKTVGDTITGEVIDEGIFVHDMTRRAPTLPPKSVDAVVTESWLGPARSAAPAPREAERFFDEINALLQKTCTNLRTVLKPGASVVVAVPAFRTKGRILHAPFLESQPSQKRVDRFPPLGYTREHGVPADWQGLPLFRGTQHGTLLYGRPDAVVLREIVRLRRTS